MTSTRSSLPDTLANSIDAAVQAARAAASAAAHVAASAFVAATDGEGSIRKTWRGEGLDAWCLVNGPGLVVHLLRDLPGTHARIRLAGLPQQAYDRIRVRCLDSDECPHDEACECLDNPWPTWAELQTNPDDSEIACLDGEERGFARFAFGRAEVTLHEEPAALVYELIRLARMQD
ncbi:hypothetical protein [Streptomyces noursei]|uniref:hypothetical protein n=1 Tax=Streptomyces noursei TaxID=1971 RepID=UPI001678EDC4|nr:hypothetical protein [Streptomyces noursei]MCZ1021426.1 hypothetical protein [Streptomyces noursei]GGX46379.1 hypothetical protein GCM10010341_80130 [Streptomyces noursei]